MCRRLVLLSIPNVWFPNNGNLYHCVHCWRVLFMIVVCPAMMLVSSCERSSPTQPHVDTSSHNFSWQMYRLGDGISNFFTDIALVHDSLAFAVGSGFLNDSTGRLDPIVYNSARWDGHDWKFQRVPYEYQGQLLYRAIGWVFALSDTDVWFENSVHWDGHTYRDVDIGTSIFYGIGSNKMWGDSTGRLYVVGNKGTIAYSPDHGQSWQQLPSGTTLDIRDVFGNANPTTGSTEILAVAGNPYLSSDHAILKISGTSVSALNSNAIDQALTGTWLESNDAYWVVGGGMYEKHSLGDSSWAQVPTTVTPKFTEAVRGNAWNDIVIVGDFGVVLHYDGSTWMNYSTVTGFSVGVYYSVAMKGNLIMAVGANPPNAIALIGRRTR